jgi:hypothetical protein
MAGVHLMLDDYVSSSPSCRTAILPRDVQIYRREQRSKIESASFHYSGNHTVVEGLNTLHPFAIGRIPFYFAALAFSDRIS